jgi:hypothetical protein
MMMDKEVMMMRMKVRGATLKSLMKQKHSPETQHIANGDMMQRMTLEAEEDDPYLKAVGGAYKLLTCEAYQQMLLRNSRNDNNKVEEIVLPYSKIKLFCLN